MQEATGFSTGNNEQINEKRTEDRSQFEKAQVTTLEHE
jgi:hypothetical protein